MQVVLVRSKGLVDEYDCHGSRVRIVLKQGRGTECREIIGTFILQNFYTARQGVYDNVVLLKLTVYSAVS